MIFFISILFKFLIKIILLLSKQQSKVTVLRMIPIKTQLEQLSQIPIQILEQSLLQHYRIYEQTSINHKNQIVKQISKLSFSDISPLKSNSEIYTNIQQRLKLVQGDLNYCPHLSLIIIYKLYGQQLNNSKACKLSRGYLTCNYINFHTQYNQSLAITLIKLIGKLDKYRFRKYENIELCQTLQSYTKYLPNKLNKQIVYFFIDSDYQQKISLQILQYIDKYMLEIYIREPSQEIFQILKHFIEKTSHKKLNNVHYSQILRQKYLSLIYGNLYTQKIAQKSGHVFMILKVLQLFHVVDQNWKIGHQFTNNSQLSARRLKEHIFICLCDHQTKGASVLTINIYSSILNDLNLFKKQTQLFIDLYLTLDSYGTHLIKDVWSNFYQICQILPKTIQNQNINQNSLQISMFELLDCLLNKVSTHTNNNIPKYCIQALLQEKSSSYSLFQLLPDTLYITLPKILNNGAHYHDCLLFHHDSKMYPYIRNYYLQYYQRLYQNKQTEKLKHHQKILLRNISEYITFQHAIVAYIGILRDMPPIYQLSLQDLSRIIKIYNRFYGRLTVRKKYMLLRSGCQFIGNNLSNSKQNIGIGDLVQNFLIKLPAIEDVCMNYADILKIMKIQQFCQQKVIQAMQKQFNAYLQLEKSMESQSQILELMKIQVQKNLMLQKVYEQRFQKQQSQNYSISNYIYLTLPQLIKSFYFNQQKFIKALTVINYSCKYSVNLPKINTIQDVFITITKYYDEILTLNKTPQIALGLNIIEQCVSMIKISKIGDQASKSVAKLVEYCLKKLTISYEQNTETKNIYENILVTVLKTKVQNTCKFEAIQESLYNLYQQIKNPQNKTYIFSSKNKLRIQLLLICILCKDQQFINKNISHIKDYQANIVDYCQIYDYQHYQELFRFIKVLAGFQQNYLQYKQQQFIEQLNKALINVLQSMLHNLDYGVHRKQVISASDCVVHLAILSKFSETSLNLLKYLLVNVGERYWGFQRHITFSIIRYFNENRVQQLPNNIYLPQIIEILVNMQQYRGQDSSILLPEHSLQSIYVPQNKLNSSSDYDGSTLRFATIQWINRLLNQTIKNKDIRLIIFWKNIVNRFLKVCGEQSLREKMFLTGTHKIKIKIWQALLTFSEFIEQIYQNSEIQDILKTCINILSHNNLVQVKHYSQIFIMRLINTQKQIDLEPVQLQLRQRISQIYGQTNLLKNITYVVLSGVILNKKFNSSLYTALFANTCSHIAYFRGLSQYFCYTMISTAKQQITNQIQLSTIQILYRQFLKDEDAINLTNLIEEIMQNYNLQVKKWNPIDNLYTQKVTLNGQVVSDSYYIERFKKIGQKLTKQNKNQDGFMPYRDIWKKLCINQSNCIQNQNDAEKEKIESFQKKIDPTLDDLYNLDLHQSLVVPKKTQMKIYVISAKTVAIYGHLARVGQILGLQNLCIPQIKTIQLDEFKSVSCTAQKWLNITSHGYIVQKYKQQNERQKTKKSKKKICSSENLQQISDKQLKQLLKKIMMQITNGYQIFKMQKSISYETTTNLSSISQNMPKKFILIIDEMDILDMGKYIQNVHSCKVPLYYSTHVSSTIILWQYYLKYTLGAK